MNMVAKLGQVYYDYILKYATMANVTASLAKLHKNLSPYTRYS